MKVVDRARLFFSIVYLLISVSIVVFLREKIFYLAPSETYNFFRFLWCIACSFLGFSVLAFQLSITTPGPRGYAPTIPSYISYYPFMLMVLACLGFSIFSSIEATSGYIFYYASFMICSILGYAVDYFWQIIRKLIERK